MCGKTAFARPFFDAWCKFRMEWSLISLPPLALSKSAEGEVTEHQMPEHIQLG